MRISEVAELWRYPVKSMRGERVQRAFLDAEGVRGDRRFAFESVNAPAGKPMLSSRERNAMVLYSPVVSGQEVAVVTPGGVDLPLHSSLLLRDFQQAEQKETQMLHLLASPQRPLTDVRPVSLVSTATLRSLSAEMGRAIDSRRFRSNIVLTLDDAVPFAEDAWSGRVLRFGKGESAAELLLRERIPRCRMVSLDPETAEPDHTILRHLAREHEGRLGVYATVRCAGMLEENQPVQLL